VTRVIFQVLLPHISPVNGALPAMGHTALCDGGTLILHRRIPLANESDRGSEARWNAIKNAIAEYVDQVNEQARIVRWLREMWLFSS